MVCQTILAPFCACGCEIFTIRIIHLDFETLLLFALAVFLLVDQLAFMRNRVSGGNNLTNISLLVES